MLRLEVPSQISAVYLKAEVTIDVTCVPEVVDCDEDLGCVDVFCCRDWLEAWSCVKGGGTVIRVYVELRVGGKCVVFGAVVLVSFYPSYLKRLTQFFMEVSND